MYFVNIYICKYCLCNGQEALYHEINLLTYLLKTSMTLVAKQILNDAEDDNDIHSNT